MPSLSEVRRLREQAFEASMALVEQKGRDYNRDKQANGDTLFNIRVAFILGLTPSPAASALVRVADKLMRLASLIAVPGRTPAVSSEKPWDTLLDLHNYVDYAYILWLEEEMNRLNNGVEGETERKK